MKQLFAAILCLCLLAGCGRTDSTGNTCRAEEGSGGGDVSGKTEEPGTDAGGELFRVIRAENGAPLLLAKEDGGPAGVYTLSPADAEAAPKGESAAAKNGVYTGVCIPVYAPGMLLEITYGSVLETYPAKFGHVTGVTVLEEPADDRCGLYLQVLSDLWEVDTALNTGLEELGVDLSGLTDLAESEKSALAWVFGNAHGLMPITGTLEEIWEAGYLTPMTEPAEGYEDSVALYRWENGCLFSLSGSAEEGFEAQKWASGLGAYLFTDCTARQNADGTWTYEVGAEAIA